MLLIKTLSQQAHPDWTTLESSAEEAGPEVRGGEGEGHSIRAQDPIPRAAAARSLIAF